MGLYLFVTVGLLVAGGYAFVEWVESKRQEREVQRELEDQSVRRRAETLDPKVRAEIAMECRLTSRTPDSFDRCVLDGEREALNQREVDRRAQEYGESLK